MEPISMRTLFISTPQRNQLGHVSQNPYVSKAAAKRKRRWFHSSPSPPSPSVSPNLPMALCGAAPLRGRAQLGSLRRTDIPKGHSSPIGFVFSKLAPMSLPRGWLRSSLNGRQQKLGSLRKTDPFATLVPQKAFSSLSGSALCCTSLPDQTLH